LCRCSGGLVIVKFGMMKSGLVVDAFPLGLEGDKRKGWLGFLLRERRKEMNRVFFFYGLFSLCLSFLARLLFLSICILFFVFRTPIYSVEPLKNKNLTIY
jgi:hypothetical protein